MDGEREGLHARTLRPSNIPWVTSASRSKEQDRQ